MHLLPWEKVTIPVRVDVPDNLAKQLDCKVRNRAKILHASSPSEQNTDPTDDDDAATAHLPADLCKDVNNCAHIARKEEELQAAQPRRQRRLWFRANSLLACIGKYSG